MKLGIIGTGKISETALQAAVKVSGVEPVAVLSRKKETGEAFMQKAGIEMAVFTDIDSMANSGTIDSVYIASPNSLHYEQSRRFLKNKIHVLCEKPATVTPEQLRDLINIAEQNGVIYLEGMLPLYTSRAECMCSAIEKIGDIREASLCFSQLSVQYPAYLRGENPNILSTEYAAGALMDLGVYCVHMAIFLFGSPAKVAASCAVKLPNGCDCSGMALLEYKDKIIALRYSKVGKGFGFSEIIGERGAIAIPKLNVLSNVTHYNANGETEELIGSRSHVDAFVEEFQAFSELAVKQGEQAGRYKALKAQFICAAETMYEIRQKAGIRFPAETELLLLQ